MPSSQLAVGLIVAACVQGALGHGWVTNPVSKNAIAFKLKSQEFGSFAYEPQSSANGNLAGKTLTTGGSACGAQSDLYVKGPSTWQKYYDQAKIPMPTLTPGSEMNVTAKMSADHGGQAWMMIACGDQISDNIGWVYLNRSESDRERLFMPSNPTITAWKVGQFGGRSMTASYHVPSNFACPSGKAVGRWLWKTGNSCSDSQNIGRSTEKFNAAEFSAIAGRALGVCTKPPETFISCLDFQTTEGGGGAVGGGGGGTSQPPAPKPKPTPAPKPEPAVGKCCYNGCGSTSCAGPTTYCGLNEGRCTGCAGTWCLPAKPKPTPATPATPAATPPPAPGVVGGQGCDGYFASCRKSCCPGKIYTMSCSAEGLTCRCEKDSALNNAVMQEAKKEKQKFCADAGLGIRLNQGFGTTTCSACGVGDISCNANSGPGIAGACSVPTPATPATPAATPPPAPGGGGGGLPSCMGCRGCLYATGACHTVVREIVVDEKYCGLWTGNIWCGGGSASLASADPLASGVAHETVDAVGNMVHIERRPHYMDAATGTLIDGHRPLMRTRTPQALTDHSVSGILHATVDAVGNMDMGAATLSEGRRSLMRTKAPERKKMAGGAEDGRHLMRMSDTGTPVP